MASSARSRGDGVTFPTSPDELDPVAMTSLLGTDALDGSRIANVRTHPIGAEHGLLGQVCVVEIDYSGTVDLPDSFVAKMPAANPASRATARRGDLYRREHHFFTQLAPRHDLSIPRCWAARFDEGTYDFLLVLDRVEPLDAVDQIVGCSVDRAEGTITELAKLHAGWWNDAGLARLDWLPTFATPERTANLTALARRGWPRLAEVAPDLLETGDAEVGAAMSGQTPQLLTTLDAQTPTVIHGDARLDNLLFRRGETTPVIIDWQGISRGPGMLDIGYFLTQSLTVQDRRRHGRRLVEHYRAELAQHGVDPPSLHELLATFALAARFSLIVACSVAALGPLERGRVRNLARCMAQRSLRAIHDLDLELEEAHP
jgi:hypothetical protein